MDRKAEQIGGWGSIGASVLSIALVGLVAMAETTAHGRAAGARGAVGAAPIGTLALAAVRVAFAAAVALGVRGVQAALAPPSIVTRVGTWAGWLGAAMLAIASIAALVFSGPSAPAWVGGTSYWSPLALGVWLLCTAAAAWKLKRLPPWIRVVAAIEGAMLFMQPAIPELGLLALPVGLVWWFGLGLALLAASRAPFPPPASASDTGLNP